MTEAATSASAADTAYMVLSRDDSGFWSETMPRILARTPEAAVKAAAAKKQSGTYVAVPWRSWKPVKVTAKTETTLVVEEVKEL